jgi:transcription elongation factor SPT4
MESFELRKLRACMVCSALRTFDQFRESGCPNCEAFLNLRDSVDRIVDCTSTLWSGTIGVVHPEGSWVVRWQRGEGRSVGLYAVKVVGRLPEEVLEVLESRDIRPVVSDS